MAGGGDSDAFRQLFGENLAALYLGCRLGGTEYFKSVLLEAVDDAPGEGVIGADDGQTNLPFFGEGDQTLDFAAELVALRHGRVDADIDAFG